MVWGAWGGLKKVLDVGVLVAALVWDVVSRGRYSRRQKLTVTVETPAGEVSGSSVSAVSWRKQWFRWDGMGWSYDLTGEAVVVEVAPGRYLFALLKGGGDDGVHGLGRCGLDFRARGSRDRRGAVCRGAGQAGPGGGGDRGAGGSLTDAGDVWGSCGPGHGEAGRSG